MAHTRAVVVAIVIAAASLAGWWAGRQDPGATADTTVPGPSRFAAVVTAPVDGDTVHVRTARGNETVRFLGVNTPTRRRTYLLGWRVDARGGVREDLQGSGRQTSRRRTAA